ncbi:hypothetical protein FOG18_04670 [Legionella israelensis]|uniref:hypothetical protein n=1 Tax=Legionella israelensis TaxID=454 RepID=UPI00117CA720|nr:hypothetical protein [Legionella israelensis]QDP71917.1 hypothetical protein FOG18_04670 [Legionella israelensis]
MYSETYPHLSAKYQFGNFETIMETLDRHFKGLFNLSILENEVKAGKLDGSYIRFFDLIISKLDNIWTVDEVSQKVYDILQKNKEVRDCFLERLIFVPPVGEAPSSQLGFHEKTATGELKVAEPVSFLDMLRVTEFLKQLRQRRSFESLNFSVFNLNSIPHVNAENIKLKNTAIMVNFNRDPQGIPKWGVVDLRNPYQPQVYCETPLLEAEKKELEEKLDIQFKEVTAGKADSLPSTGYTAIAWLDQNISKGWNFDIAADFNDLLDNYIFAQFRGDGGGVVFQFVGNEYNDYCTEEFKAVNEAPYSRDHGGWGGFAPIKMIRMATLPVIEGHRVKMNSLVDVIKIFGENRLDNTIFNQYMGLSFRSNVLGFARTLMQELSRSMAPLPQCYKKKKIKLF